jgi:N-alpha-acetyl-L-2,4-diaminobutyrate deacetylase
MEGSRIRASFDLDASGKHRGYLTVPWSRDDSAWGSIQMPITVVRNGRGPRLLLLAGNHGDEYEGPIALMKLAAALEAEAVRGVVTILPTMNHPAVLAARRTSPIDGGNMNRVFPGARGGSPTAMIAHFVYHQLVARADVVVDLHSGGKTLDFVPSVILHELDDPLLMQRTIEAGLAFGAPLALVIRELDTEGMLDVAVEALGKLFVTTELGGGGSTTPARVAIAERGVRNLLRHLGVIDGAPEAPDPPSRLMQTPAGGFVVCRTAGMFEPQVELGARVEKGAPLGQVHFFEDREQEPHCYAAPCAGMLYARHFPGLIKRGDCLAVIAAKKAAAP